MPAPTRLQNIQQSSMWSQLLPTTHSRFTNLQYDPTLRDWSFVQVLIAGAGGIGCELLHQLVMCGFAQITIIDMDKVQLSNLNRQFLFRQSDIGQYKSVVAANYINNKFSGIHVTAVVGKVEHQTSQFYKSFQVILLALDSVEARIWVNNKIASLAQRAITNVYNHYTNNISSKRNSNSISNSQADNNISNINNNINRNMQTTRVEMSISQFSSVQNNEQQQQQQQQQFIQSNDVYVITNATMMIDTGTEGYQGHCRIVDMSLNHTPCIECVRELFVQQTQSVPLCTLQHIPRRRQHCVLYAAQVLFPRCYQGDTQRQVDVNTTRQQMKNNTTITTQFNLDSAQHINWVSQQARKRQVQFHVQLQHPIDVRYTLGVLKHIVPAVNFTNSFVAGEAVLELMKWLCGIGTMLKNFAMINGAASYGGLHLHTQQLKVTASMDKIPSNMQSCAVCSPLPVICVSLQMTIYEIDALIDKIYTRNNNNNNDINTVEVQDQLLDKEQKKSTLVFSVAYNSGIANKNDRITIESSDNIMSIVPYRVYLSYKEGHPLAKPICGHTLYDILVNYYGMKQFVQAWQYKWREHQYKQQHIITDCNNNDKHVNNNNDNDNSKSCNTTNNNTCNNNNNNNNSSCNDRKNWFRIVATSNEVIIPVIERVAEEGKPSRRVAVRLKM